MNMKTCVVVGIVAALGLARPLAASAADAKLDDRLALAKTVYQELLSTPDRDVPQALRDQSQCIAIIPGVIKGAVGYGARFGRGVMSCRNAQGDWSPPTFLTLSGGSVGFQFGAESTDLVLFFMTERGARSLITSSKLTLGGKAGVAAGPFGRSGEASTDLKLTAEIYSYARSKVLFAGISLEGARLAPDEKSNTRYYGQPVTAKQLLFEHPLEAIPPQADTLRRAFPKSGV